MGAILGFFGGLLGALLKIFIQTPPPVAVEDQKLGQPQVTAATDAQSAKTEGDIAQAETNAPKTQGQVVDAMKNGTF